MCILPKQQVFYRAGLTPFLGLFLAQKAYLPAGSGAAPGSAFDCGRAECEFNQAGRKMPTHNTNQTPTPIVQCTPMFEHLTTARTPAPPATTTAPKTAHIADLADG